MSSLPYILFTSQDEKDLLTIQEHQNFCKQLLKSYQSYEKRKSEEKIDKNKFKSEEEFLQAQRKQNQDKILKWFENLTEYERIKICTIKNKWLINILIQLYLIYKTYDECYIKPIMDMEELFQPQKNFEFGGEDYNNYMTQKNTYNTYKYFSKELNNYENFFRIKYLNNNYNLFNKDEVKRRDIEKNFIDKVKILSIDENILDTLTLSKDILIDSKQIKFFLKFFSKNEYFQDWLLPIKVKNIYNFVLPHWMHNNENLTLFQLIIGYIEQQIILNYEYYYYSKKIYENSFSKIIVSLYEENEKLISFVKENYSFHGHNDTNKAELISLMDIREIVEDVKKNKINELKIEYIQNIYNYVFSNEFNPNNRNCILNKDFAVHIYEDLYKEMIKEGEFGVMKIIEHITFMKFIDIVNGRDFIFTSLRKKIDNNRIEKIENELISKDFLSSSSNKKKNKNKKKKKKNKNKENINKNNENIKENINTNSNTNTNTSKSEEDKKENENINILQNNNKEIKEFTINDDKDNISKKMEKKEEKNINLNINNNNKNIIDEDINIINNNNELNSNFLTEYEKKELKYLISNKKGDISLNINNNNNEQDKINEKKVIEEEITSINKKKPKNKDIFLYPINAKKKNKKKKNLRSLSAKKKIETKDKNIIEDKKDIKNNSNSPTPKIKLEKDKNILIYNNINIDFNVQKQKNQEINLCQPKSLSPLSSQHQSFSFYQNVNNSPKKNDLNISKDISTNINIPKNNVVQIQSSMNLTFESKNHVIENNSIDNSNNINNTNNINNDNIDNTNNNFINNYSNIPIISNMYTPYTPSEKFFESLTKEINNYLLITNNNMSNLKPIHLKYLTEIENLIKTGLENKYEIKFGHYGSYFTNLSIEGSDLDILINYKSKNNDNNNDFYKDLLSLLNENENKFELINPILTASVPVIKLQIDIKNEINNLKLKQMIYFEDENELQKINFDLTFTQDEQEYQHSHQIVSYINQSLISYPIIKSLLLLLKRYFKIMKMNKSFHGGLSSYSLYLLIYTFCKKFPVLSSPGKTLYSFLAFFSVFEFEKFGVDVDNINIYYYLNNNYIYNNYNIYEEENIKKEINIKDPLTKLNVAKSSFKVEEIQNTFRIAHNFLRTEGCYYDYAVLVNKTGYENDYFKHIKTNYDLDNDNDFKVLKKLFALNKKHFFFDFFAN